MNKLIKKFIDQGHKPYEVLDELLSYYPQYSKESLSQALDKYYESN